MEKAEKLTQLIKRIESEGQKLKENIDFLMETTASENFIEDHHFLSTGYFDHLLKTYIEVVNSDET